MSFHQFTDFYTKASNRGAIKLPPSGRLQGLIREGVLQQRNLAWRLLPVFLLFFLATLAFAMNITSHLGEEGRSLAYQGSDYQFESPVISESSSLPPNQPEVMQEITPPQEQELVADIEIDPTEPTIEATPALALATEMPLIEEPSPFTEEDIAALDPQPIAQENSPPTPQKKEKTKPKPSQANSTASIASQQAVSKSVVGESSASAEGRVSVSYKEAPIPPYPARLRAAKIEGSVLVRIEVDALGKPLRVSIKQSSGHQEFDDVAQSWILNRWSFNPAQENGRAIASVVTTRVHFEYN